MMKQAHMAGTAALLAGVGRFPLGVIFAAAATPESLRAEKEDIQAASQEIVDAADGEERDLTDDEVGKIEANKAKVEKIDRQIAAREAAKPVAVGTGRRTAAEPANAGSGKIAATVRNQDPRYGFQNFGEFVIFVKRAELGDGEARTRFANVATTYGNEGSGADGGFAVPPEFKRTLWEKVQVEENLMTRTDQLVTGSNNMTVPKDETTPWQTSGGVQVYWESEGGVKTPSKPALEMMTLRLNKVVGLVPVSDELLEDAPGLESWLRSKVPAKIISKINTAIIDGNGVGKPLGILRAPSLVTVAKETSQPADTIHYANIVKMWSRMYGPSRRNAIWIINQDIEPQLNAMAFSSTATSPVPAYMPAGGLSTAPYATLMGRPVVPVEAAKTLGDVGDIILVDLSQYMTLTKGGGVKTDVSMHLYFDQDLTAFRFVLRMTGMPAWGAAITPENGSLTRSWAVALAERG